MAIVRYCIINTGAPVGRCTAVISWDDANTYYPPSGSVVAGDNTGEVGQTYDGGSSPGGTWFPAAAPSYSGGSDGGPIIIADGGTGASDAATARTNLGLGTTDNPQFATIELGAASDTSLSRASAGRIAVEGATVAHQSDFLGQQTIWVPAGAMIARTTTGAARGTAETTTNRVMLSTLDFDTAAQEFAQFAIQMPNGWDEGTLVAQFVYCHPTGTGTVMWQIQATAFANDDPADTAFPAAATTSAQTVGTANDIYVSSEVSFTVGGTPGAEEFVVFQVARVPASDTLTVDARLLGVKIHYTINAAKDD